MKLSDSHASESSQRVGTAIPLLPIQQSTIAQVTGPGIAPSGDIAPIVQPTRLGPSSGKVVIRSKTDASEVATKRAATPAYYQPPTTRLELHEHLHAEKPTRDKEGIAELLCAYRPNKHAAGYDRSSSVKSVQIPLPVLKAWAGKIGRMTPEQVEGTFGMIRKAGRFVPLGSFIANVVGYGAIPFALLGVKNIWILPAVTGVVAVAQPVVTSYIAPYVNRGVESWRAKYAPMMKRPEGTGARLATEVIVSAKSAAAALKASAGRIDEKLRVWTLQHDLGPLDATGEARAERLTALNEKLDDSERAEWQGMAGTHQTWLDRTHREDDDLDAAYVYENREKVANEKQGWYARVPRTAGGFFGPTVAAPGRKSSPMDHWLAPENRWTTRQVTGLAVGISLFATFAQLWAAGVDEEAALAPELTLQLLFGKVLGLGGQAKWNRGEKIDASDIDDAMCDKLYEDPAQSMVSNVLKIITQRRDRLQQTADAHGDLPGAATRHRIARYDTDIAALEANQVLDPRLSDETVGLLDDVVKPWAVNFWRQDGTAKLRDNDLPKQVAQRIAVSLLLGCFGNAASLALGGFLLASIGGRTAAPLHERWVIQWIVVLIGVVSATLQFTATLTKTRARADNTVGFMAQTVKGIYAPVTYFRGRLGEASTKQEITNAFEMHHRHASEAMALISANRPEEAGTLERINVSLAALVNHPALQRHLSGSVEGASVDMDALQDLVQTVGREGAAGLRALAELRAQVAQDHDLGATDPLLHMLDTVVRQLEQIEVGAASLAPAGMAGGARVEDVEPVSGSSGSASLKRGH